ncbi:M23 family metallopeptidase [Pseudodesulfovibrio sediminis]|uniref:Peptidase M24 n=1 Tax=Pseudodesulfovibrio sediminis TaxID=2810563 RepID=A0ABN6EPK7_9BACT|nr:peptidoglycan DD-metalloendopeptidase family protein [Pseudodesulfovibrio sediminis]BCS88396.1 peptidase M24 [Pseudodesulfovibrio sediminis]
MNNVLRVHLLGVMLCLLMAGSALAGDRVELLVPEQVGVGKPFLLRIVSWYPLENVQVEWNEKTVRPTVTRPGEKSEALLMLGIGLRKDLGTYPLKVTVDIWGHTYHFSRNIKVVESVWGKETLRVAPKMVDPPAEVLDRIKAERAQILAALNQVTPERFWDLPFVLPTKGKMLSRFGLYRVFNGHTKSRHTGLDFRAWKGTPLHSIAAGRVVLTDHFYYAGNAVLIDHGNGLFSMYDHLSRILVGKGDVVQPGQRVGLSGATGRVTGAHLHLAVFVLGGVVDPEVLFESSVDNIFK